ncbi:MAG: hypothetical protein ACREKF_13630, partial [Candidatus Methylomirabilales bacterium]
PIPAIHDEFSYLLAADTFASGRLTTPPHPHWVHFESIHILQQPTYTSKYPPAQGLALALGQRLGHPILGVWLSVALACAALTWMLQAWLPPTWALLGGLLAATRLGPFSYWAQSYWGGAVPALGGALLFGALRRLHPHPHPRDALLFGLGLALLANSRPYEGLLVSLVAGAVLLGGLLGPHRPPVRVALTRLLLPLGLVLSLTAAAMTYYNYRVTGNPLRLPYQVHEATYGIAPTFLWQSLRPEPEYRHEVLREYYRSKAAKYVRQHSLSGLVAVKARQLGAAWGFYLGPVLTLPLVMLPWALRGRWMRLALLTCGVLGVGLSSGSWMNPHYAAPATAVLYALVLGCMRRLRLWRWRGRLNGRVLVWAILALCVVVAPYVRVKPRAQSLAASQHRARLLAQLEGDGNRHLVIVRHWPLHNHWNWVYNRADIEAAKVIWAREMDLAHNRELLAYFKDRRAWLLEADADPPRLAPYPVGSAP